MEETEPRILPEPVFAPLKPSLARDEIVKQLAAALRRDEQIIEKLSASMHRHRRSSKDTDQLAWHSIRDGMAAPGNFIVESMKPSSLHLRPSTLADIWRQVGGYLGQSVEKARADREDE